MSGDPPRAATVPLEKSSSGGSSFPSTPLPARLAASSKEDDFFADPDPARQGGELEEDTIENGFIRRSSPHARARTGKATA